MPTPIQVASYFLEANSPYSITDLKIQKLCSYAQAIHIAYLGKTLFDEFIEMWELGPVIPSLYATFKQYGHRPIPKMAVDMDVFTGRQRFVLAAVNDYYNLYDAWGLCEQSHRDFPGIRGTNQPLTKQELSEAFKNNPLVLRLKQADLDKLPKAVDNPLSANEFWDAVSA